MLFPDHPEYLGKDYVMCSGSLALVLPLGKRGCCIDRGEMTTVGRGLAGEVSYQVGGLEPYVLEEVELTQDWWTVGGGNEMKL